MGNNERLFSRLVEDASDHGLVLFIGSGINSGMLPQWNALLCDILGQAIREGLLADKYTNRAIECLQKWGINNFDVCAQASIVKQILGPERYRIEVQDALYRNVSADIEKDIREYCSSKPPEEKINPKFEFLRTIAELCCQPQVKAAATFNFDTLLEYAISSMNKKTRAYFGRVALFESEKYIEQGFFPIFHLHGLLSPPGILLRNFSDSLVFSYDEYFEKNADPLSWETSTSIHLLRHFCTLWVGASLRDWNMLRLLDAARRGGTEIRAYCIQSLEEVSNICSSDYGGDKDESRPLAMRLQATLLDAVGVKLIVAGDEYKDIPSMICKITDQL